MQIGKNAEILFHVKPYLLMTCFFFFFLSRDYTETLIEAGRGGVHQYSILTFHLNRNQIRTFGTTRFKIVEIVIYFLILDLSRNKK